MEKKFYTYPCVKIVEIEKNDLICCSNEEMGMGKDDDITNDPNQ